MTRLIRRSGDLPKRSLWQRIKDIALTDVTAVARPGAKRVSLEQLEEILLDADFGVTTTLRMVADVERLAQRGEVRSEEEYFDALRVAVEQALLSGNADPRLHFAPNGTKGSEGAGPTVIVVIGVNGAGKTTFIGKLAAQLKREGKRVLLAAADTFRAGAIDQLRLWAERVGVEFVGGQAGGDAAAVAFNAIEAALTRGLDVVIVDTAGRLHTSGNLMDELKKVVRVIQRRLPDAPHEVLLVLDGTIGQNAVAQAKTFAAAVPVTGLVVTKVDGTAKGGIVIAVHEAIDVPVKFIGVGEKVGDLERFNASEFAAELLSG
ncbi:MAG: signal recognition particle-docking protein FtsY [Gemmatimonadaceae bacterium]